MSSGKHKVKATIYDKKGNVLSVGYNSYTKTHPRQAELAKKMGEEYKVFLHAEIAALVKCRKPPFKIKIERFDKLGNPVLAKPCPICEEAIRLSGIKFVEYTV